MSCNEPGVTTFDVETHTFSLTLTTDQYSDYEKGYYKFRIAGDTGGNTPLATYTDFIVNLVDLCKSDVQLSLVSGFSYRDMVYELTNDVVSESYLKTDLFYLTPDIDCGQAQVEFYNELDGKILNSAMFKQE